MFKYNEIASKMGALETLTPADISNYSDEEVMALADSLSDPCKIPVKVRYNLLKTMFSCVGYELSPDLLLSLLVETKQQLILAPAGGCKTTSSQIKVLFSKIIWKLETGRHLTASECLCLVYNRENKPQMLSKHSEILNRLLSFGFVSLNPDDENPKDGSKAKIYVNSSINALTMHAFSNTWIQNYADVLGISGFKLMSAEQESSFINSAIRKLRKGYPHISFNIKADKVKLVYDLVHGLLLDYDSITLDNPVLHEAIAGSGADPAHLAQMFKDYDRTKKYMKLLDYTDQLSLMDKLLRTEPDVRRRLQVLFPYIVVDEIQDFTPLMMQILQNIVGDETKLLCIGDEDQSIYSFRGADIDNALKFSEKFPRSKVFQLLVNRRCGDVILNAAAKIIELNLNRYDKKLVATRKGGKIDLVPYLSVKDMLSSLSERIGNLSYEDQNDTVICVRDKVYGQPLSKMLFDLGVPYHTFNVQKFENHEIIRNFIDIMNVLWAPGRENWKTLFKILNISKADWFNYLGVDADRPNAQVKNFQDVTVWWDLDFKPFSHYRYLRETLNRLYQIAQNISKVSCKSYVSDVLNFFVENYWLARCRDGIIPYSEEALVWVKELFGKEQTYPVIYREFSDRSKTLYRNDQNKEGVTIATFHSLKGLEFKNVFMTFLNDNIFPGFSMIESKNYDSGIEARLKESETRLAYVAMTRAKDYLGMYYDAESPSIYVQELDINSNVGFRDRPQIKFSSRKDW